jgi:hypothetical protein
MLAKDRHPDQFLDFEKPTDMEIAMHILRLLEGSPKSNGQEDHIDWRTSIVSMAKKALSAMTNPFAMKLLADQIGK